MKKTIKLLTIPALLATTLGMVGCNKNENSSSTSSSSNTSATTSSSSSKNNLENADLILYFYRFDENYSDVGAWFWGDGLDGRGMMFDSSSTVTLNETGEWKWLAVGIKFDESYEVYTDWGFGSSEKTVLPKEYWANLIIRSRDGTKDVDADRSVDLTKVDDDGIIRVYSITGNETLFYDEKDIPTSPINEVSMSTLTSIKMSLYFAFEKSLSVEDFSIRDESNKKYAINKLNKSSLIYEFVLENEFSDFTTQLYLDYDGHSYPINYRGVFNKAAFNKLYQYDGKDLGANVNADGSETVFKVWSPSASAITINFYESSTSNGIKESFDMVKGEKGVWSYKADRDLHGIYYTYTIDVLGKTNKEVADPYASSSNANGKRSLVVNWEKIETNLTNVAPEVVSPSSVTVYETHVRDFSMSDSWNGKNENRGKYLGMIEEGTKLSTGESTGFDYIKNSGVTHIQLQPVYDFASVDETKLNDKKYQTAHRGGIYNWGYDPYSYSSLEGSYSSDPNDGLTRINEFRKLTNAYNAAGIGVIMDVVYNHVPSGADSTYEKIMPNYYFRTNSYSGAGTDLASENSMVKNMIVQTTEQLVKRYNLAGFRFDLMGLITKSAMQMVESNLKSFDPDIILYGEGWSMYEGDKYLGKEMQAVQGAFKATNKDNESDIGFFNDSIRDGLKGSVFDDSSRGFAQAAYDPDTSGLNSLKTKILFGLVGTQQSNIAKWSYDFTGVSINYAECHDNLTIHDKLYASDYMLSESERNKIQTEINNIIAFSTGVSFYQLGQEFARSKELDPSWLEGADKVTEKYSAINNGETTRYFVSDSYDFSDEINAINWNLIHENNDMVTAFRKAITLRNSEDLANLKPTSFENMQYSELTYEEICVEELDYEKMLGYSISNDSSRSLAFVFNTSSKIVELNNSELVNNAKKFIYNGEEVSSLPTTMDSCSYLIVIY